MDNINPRRIFLYLLIGSVSLSALIGIGVLLLGDFGIIEVRVLMTTMVVTIVSVLGLACGAYIEVRGGKHVPFAGIAFSVIAGLMSFFLIWNVLDDEEIFIKSFLTATLLAAACSHISLLSLARLDQRFSWTRISAVVCIILLCSILLFILWFEPEGESDLIYRLLGVLGILLASITVVTPVLHKLSSNETGIAKIDAEIERLKQKLEELEAERNRLTSELEAES
jgi:signal transduction histidine kinase